MFESVYDHGARNFAVQVATAPHVPQQLSTIAGDIIQNLRSSLDYVAWQLVYLDRGEPWRWSQFPIADTWHNLFNGQRKTIFDKLSPHHAALIKKHQPFSSIEDFSHVTSDTWEVPQLRRSNLVLRDLRDLSNQDKHRLLLRPYFVGLDTEVTVTSLHGCTAPSVLWARNGYSLQPDSEVMRWDVIATSGRPRMTVDCEFRPDIQIEYGPPFIDMLDAFFQKCAQIICDFEPSFTGVAEERGWFEA